MMKSEPINHNTLLFGDVLQNAKDMLLFLDLQRILTIHRYIVHPIFASFDLKSKTNTKNENQIKYVCMGYILSSWNIPY